MKQLPVLQLKTNLEPDHITLMPQNGGAVLKTEWGQDNPYNLLLPKIL